jgi:hypothetical protein
MPKRRDRHFGALQDDSQLTRGNPTVTLLAELIAD